MLKDNKLFFRILERSAQKHTCAYILLLLLHLNRGCLMNRPCCCKMHERSCLGCRRWAVCFFELRWLVWKWLPVNHGLPLDRLFQRSYFQSVTFTSLIRWEHTRSRSGLGLPVLLSSILGFLFASSLEGGKREEGMVLMEAEQCCEASFQ